MNAIRPLLAAAAALLALLGAVFAQTAQQEAPSRAVVLVQIDGVIGPPAARHLHDGVEKAEERNAEALILQINTPGGLETSMRDMIEDILRSRIPVVGFVAPSGGRAASAGAFILYSTHVAAMAPGTNVGAATPVDIGGTPTPTPTPAPIPTPTGAPDEKSPVDVAKEKAKAPAPSDAMSRKAMNDSVAFIRSLAELRGRNADWGEDAVRNAAAVSAREALRLDVIEFIADDIDDLLTQLDGRTVTVQGVERTLHTRGAAIERVEATFMTRVLDVLANPNLAFLLLMIGVYGIIFELANPGSWAPGVIGAIALVLGLYALNQLPLNYAGLALILLGLGLMIAEAFTPTFGALGIIGLASFLFGAFMLIDTDLPEYRLSLPLIIGVGVLTGGFLLLVVGFAVRAHRRRVATGAEGLIGQRARVLDWANGEGFVWAEGERWQAWGPPELKPNQHVRITRVDSLRLHVAEESQGESA